MNNQSKEHTAAAAQLLVATVADVSGHHRAAAFFLSGK